MTCSHLKHDFCQVSRHKRSNHQALMHKLEIKNKKSAQINFGRFMK